MAKEKLRSPELEDDRIPSTGAGSREAENIQREKAGGGLLKQWAEGAAAFLSPSRRGERKAEARAKQEMEMGRISEFCEAVRVVYQREKEAENAYYENIGRSLDIGLVEKITELNEAFDRVLALHSKLSAGEQEQVIQVLRVSSIESILRDVAKKVAGLDSYIDEKKNRGS